MSDEEDSNEVQNNNEEEEEINEEVFIQNIEKINDYQIPHKYLFRICLLGEAGVGKTSLLTQFCDNTFKENYNNTIGVDFRLVTLKYKNTIVKVHIWDTAGQERFKSLASNYISKSHGFIFVYDVTEKNSFQNIKIWTELASDKNKMSICKFLIGNKIDKEGQRQVTQNEGEQFAKENKFNFLETSAKSSENVQKLFYYFTYKLMEYYHKNEYVDDDNIDLTHSKIEDIPTVRPSQNKCNC